MKYMNTKTGNVIDVPCAVSGPDWELLQEKKPETEKKVPEKSRKTARKKGD